MATNDIRTLLARTLQAEAGSQGYQGMIDVGSVIANRVASKGYGSGYEGVIMKPGQFSAWNSATGYAGGAQGQNMGFEPNRTAYEAADAILSGNYQDQTGGATHYYAKIPGVSDEPDWAKGKSQTKRGAHYFLNADGGRDGPTREAASSGALPNFAKRSQENTDTLNRALLDRNFAADAGEPYGQTREPVGGAWLTAPDGTPLVLGQRAPQIQRPMARPSAMITGSMPESKIAAATGTAPVVGETSGAGVANQPNEVSAVSTSGDNGSRSFSDKVAETLFPNSDGPRSKLGQALSAIGIGLGQMSHGQAVNLQPYFQGQAAQRQAIIDQQQKDRDNAINRAFKERDYSLRAAQAQVAAGRLALDQQQLATEVERANAPVFSADTLLEYDNDPELSPFVPMLTSADPSVKKSGVDGIRSVLVDRAKAEADTKTGGNFGRLFEALAEDGPVDYPKIAKIVDEEGLGSEDVSRAMTMLGRAPTAFQNDLNEYMEAKQSNPAKAKAMEAAWQRPDETPRERENRQLAYKNMDALDNAASANSRSNAELGQLERLFQQMVDSGDTGGKIASIVAAQYGNLRFVLGEGVANKAMELAGIKDPTAYEQLNPSVKMLTLLMAQPLMQGGGSVSDAERQTLAESLVSGTMTPEVALMAVTRLRAMNKFDEVVASQYGSGLSDDYTNARTLRRDLEAEARAIMPDVLAANQEQVAARNAGKGSFSAYVDLPAKERFARTSPVMTQQQYNMYGSILTPLKDGKPTWRRLNEDGTVTNMLGDEEL